MLFKLYLASIFIIIKNIKLKNKEDLDEEK